MIPTADPNTASLNQCRLGGQPRNRDVRRKDVRRHGAFPSKVPLERRREGERVGGMAGRKRVAAAAVRALAPSSVLQPLCQAFGDCERLNQVHPDV
jgi:hypothetical protein